MRVFLVLALLAAPAHGRAMNRTTPPPETFPLDGAFVYNADPRCVQYGVGLTLPDLQKAVCMRSRALEYLIGEVSAKRLIPGSGFSQCDYAWGSDSSWAACVEYAIRAVTPEIRLGQSPFWTRGNISGQPWEGCAAGVAYPQHIRVSIHDLPRSYRLVSWETANAIVYYLLDLPTAGDGPAVSAATSHAAAACGVQ